MVELDLETEGRFGEVADDHSAATETILWKCGPAFRAESIVSVPRTGEVMIIKRLLGPNGAEVHRGVNGTRRLPLVNGDPLLMVGYTEEAANG